MALAVTINGIARETFSRWRTLRISKEGSTETARIEFLNHDLGAGAWRPADGDELVIRQDGALEFGGEVVTVKDLRLDGAMGGGIVTIVECRGFAYEADEVIVSGQFPAMGLLDAAAYVFGTYLAPKGWTNNGAPSGGPMLPALTYLRQSVRSIFDDWTKRAGWPWRVNGERFGGFHLPGSIMAPADLGDQAPSVVLRGMSVGRERLRRATRLFVTTGGSGAVEYTEALTGDGVRVTFPLRVEPEILPKTVIEGGTSHTIGAGRWVYGVNDVTITASTPPAAGVAITVKHEPGLELPVVVRVWDPVCVTASGAWNYATIRDASMSATEQVNIEQAIGWGNAELASRQAAPREVALSTFAQHFYPWQRAMLSFAGRAVGPYLVQSVTLTDVGRKDQRPRVDMTLLEGDAIGRDWTLYFRERGATSGGGGSVSTGGGVPVPPVTGGGGGVGFPPGTTLRLGGDNMNAYSYPIPDVNGAWKDGPQAVPMRLGGAGMAGVWTFLVPVYLLAPGTIRVRIYDQATGGALAEITSSHVAALLSGDWAFPSVNFSAPADVHGILLQAAAASGTVTAVIGQTTISKV